LQNKQLYGSNQIDAHPYELWILLLNEQKFLVHYLKIDFQQDSWRVQNFEMQFSHEETNLY
jgi:hypothetical protein